MTDGIELNGGQSVTKVPSSESENELVESLTERHLSMMRRLYGKMQLRQNELVESPTERYRSAMRGAFGEIQLRQNELVESPTGRYLSAMRGAFGEIQMRQDEQSRQNGCPALVEADVGLNLGLSEDTKLSMQKSEGTWSDQSLALLITVMSLFAGAAYMVLFSFHDAFPISADFKGVVNLSILELLTFPETATDDFLVIATVTTTFMLSMGMNTIAVCIFFRKFIRGTFLTILSLFTIVAFSVSFFAMLSKFFPHHITIAGGNLKIPATAIVIFYDIYVIILVCAFAYTVHRWRSCRRKQDAVTEPESIV